MRRRQINLLRQAGVLPPVTAFEREAWERVRQALPPVEPPQQAVSPTDSDRILPYQVRDRLCPHCGQMFQHRTNLAWHLRGCAKRPKPEAVA